MLDRASRFAPILALALLTSAAAACTKTEGQSSGTTSTTGTVPTGLPLATAAAATAAPDASPIAVDTTTGTAPAAAGDAAATTASATPGGSAKTTASAAPAASAAAECGTKPLPDCPLQAWMKANTNAAIASGDLPALAIALDKTAAFAPPAYTNWASIAKDGAKAAKAGDMAAAKASCRTCHDQYKTKYKAEMRARKI